MAVEVKAKLGRLNLEIESMRKEISPLKGGSLTILLFALLSLDEKAPWGRQTRGGTLEDALGSHVAAVADIEDQHGIVS